jgi:DNA-binding NtrC family response regulator
MSLPKPLSILVVDQDHLTLKRVTEALRDYPAVVAPSSSLEAALQVLEHQQVAVIVVDLEPPFHRAFDLLSQLRAKLPQVEVVFLSKFDEVDLWLEVIQRGAFDLLPKPLELPEVRRILRLALEQHHPVKARSRAVS